MHVYSTRKTPVGCHADAEAAAVGSLDYLDDGLFKKVYRSPDGTTVYKVTRGYAAYDDMVTEGRANALIAEAAWAAALKKRRVPGIPPVSLWLINGQPVLSMPFYPLDSSDLDYWVRNKAVQRWSDEGLDDIHGGNYKGDSRGRPKVIDLGGWGNSFPEDALPSEVYDMCRCDVSDPDDDDGYDQCECGCGRAGECDCTRCEDCDYCLECEGCGRYCECESCMDARDEDEDEDAA